jgi:hypothetical protein
LSILSRREAAIEVVAQTSQRAAPLRCLRLRSEKRKSSRLFGPQRAQQAGVLPGLRERGRLLVTGKVMSARQKAFQPLTPSPQEQSAVLIMNRQPRSILEKYSRDQVRQLYEFLHNDNPPYRLSLVSEVKTLLNPFIKTPTNSNAFRFQNQLTGQSAP